MQFSSLSDFFAMGGYAFYVWLSFGVSALLLIALIWLSKQQQQQTLKAIALRQKRHDKLRQARNKRVQSSENSQSNSLNNSPEVSDESTS